MKSNRHVIFAAGVVVVALAGGIVMARDDYSQDEQARRAAAALNVPPAIQAEHKHLHYQLDAALAAGGKTAEQARVVADVLGPHFKREEAIAMPPLGLLEALAQRRSIDEAEARQAIEMATRLRAEYDSMLDEHHAITEALRELAAAARQENKLGHAHFAEALIAHAQYEEQILYPTTLLIGEYLTLLQAHDRGR